MFSYENLDRIADSYIPTLAVIWAILLCIALFRMRWRLTVYQMSLAAACLCIAYGLMWVDNRLQIWPSLGMDYSTHTAVALALGVCICFRMRKSCPAIYASLIAYICLMLYQQYHSLFDIITTAVVVGGLSSAFVYGLRKWQQIWPDELSIANKAA